MKLLVPPSCWAWSCCVTSNILPVLTGSVSRGAIKILIRCAVIPWWLANSCFCPSSEKNKHKYKRIQLKWMAASVGDRSWFLSPEGNQTWSKDNWEILGGQERGEAAEPSWQNIRLSLSENLDRTPSIIEWLCILHVSNQARADLNWTPERAAGHDSDPRSLQRTPVWLLVNLSLRLGSHYFALIALTACSFMSNDWILINLKCSR